MGMKQLTGAFLKNGIYLLVGLLLAWGFRYVRKAADKADPVGSEIASGNLVPAAPFRDLGAGPPAVLRVSLAEAKDLSSLMHMEIVPCLQEFMLLSPPMRKNWLEAPDWKNERLLALLRSFYSIGSQASALDKNSLEQLFALASQSPSDAAARLRKLILTGTKGKLLASRFFRSNQKHPEVNAVVLHEPDLLALSTASFTWIDQYGGAFGNDPGKLQQFVNGLSSELHRTVALEAGLSRNLKYYIKSPDFLLGSIQGLSGRLKILKRWHDENPGSTEAERNALLVYFDGSVEKAGAAAVFRRE